MSENAGSANGPIDLAALSPEARERHLKKLAGAAVTAPRSGGGGTPDDEPTEIVCVVDRSGSMASIREDAVGGFNAFLEEQRRLPGRARLTLVLFDHEYDLVHDAAPLDVVAPLDGSTYQPQGTTALFDALGRTLEEVGRRLGYGSGTRVIVCVLTDGLENASRDYTAEAVRRLIEGKRSEGWAFVFLAANQDAFVAAEALSIPRQSAASFEATGRGVREGYRSMSMQVSALRVRAYEPPRSEPAPPPAPPQE